MTDTNLRAGCCQIEITPPLGVYLAGHFNARPSVGIHDPLTCQVIVLEQGGQRLALVGNDLIHVDGELTSQVRARVQTQVGIEPEQVMVWGTHTHAGPIMNAGGSEPREEAVHRLLAQQIAGAVVAAAGRLRPARLRVGWGSEERIAHNRRYRLKDGSVRTNPGVGNPEVVAVDGPIDPTVGALWVEDEQGLQAILVNFGCHLDVLGNGNFLYSADYPYYLRQALQAAYGRALVVPFANGPCGNINHINVFGTKRQGGYDHAQLMGRVLAGEVLKMEGAAQLLEVTTLRGRSEVLDLPRRPYSEAELEEFAAILADERIADRAYPKVRARTHLARHASGVATEPVEVQALQIGSLAVLGTPAEYFVEFGLQLREQCPAEHTLIVELANDNIGYVPTPQAFDEGGYEGTSARFDRDTGRRLAEALLALVSS